MQQLKFNILHNEPLTHDIFRMLLTPANEADLPILESVRAGQFVNIAISGCFLRRPISVCDIEAGKLCIVYKVVGHGTSIMANMKPGEWLDLLLPLGNGFNIAAATTKPLLIGGGVGVPPLLMLAKQLIQAGKQPEIVLGFNQKQDIILKEEFIRLGCNPIIATADGSEGIHGFVTDAISSTNHLHSCTYYYACGPVMMLKALQQQMSIEGEISMEERMGCGFGVCMGCTCHTHNGAQQVCTNGPVFSSRQLIL